jgi:hypothetical protein
MAAALLVGALAALTACGNVVIEPVGANGGKGTTGSGSAGSGEAGGASATAAQSSTTGSGGSGGPGDVPCLVGANVIYAEGDPLHPAPETISQVQWMVVYEPPNLQGSMVPSTLELAGSIQPINPSDTLDSWVFAFSSAELAGGPPLAPGVYLNATSDDSPGQPRLSVVHVSSAGPVPCDAMVPTTGQFQVEAIDFEYGSLRSFTVSFVQSCASPGAVIRGCMRYELL